MNNIILGPDELIRLLKYDSLFKEKWNIQLEVVTNVSLENDQIGVLLDIWKLKFGGPYHFTICVVAGFRVFSHYGWNLQEVIDYFKTFRDKNLPWIDSVFDVAFSFLNESDAQQVLYEFYSYE